MIYSSFFLNAMMDYFEKFKNLWKTKKALELFVEERDIELWWQILKTYRPKCSKKQSKLWWKDLADVIHSIYIRLVKSDEQGYCTCITSWDKTLWKELQNWHYRTRSHLNTRYLDDNCRPQTYRDNVILSGNYRCYALKMIELFWEEKERWLWEDKTQVKFRDWDYQDMIEWWHKVILEQLELKWLSL